MTRWINPFRCQYCGRYFSPKDPEAISYTPYGSYEDVDPPDEEYICGPCWLGTLTEKGRESVRATSWVKPQKVVQRCEDRGEEVRA